MKHLKKFGILIIIVFMSSCSQNELLPLGENDITLNNIEPSVVNNKMKFESKEALASFMKQTDDDQLDTKIKNLSKEGFRSLRPYFKKDDDIAIDNFLAKKKSRIKKKGYLYSYKNGDDGIDLDDDVISDPKFAAILDENREIYVGNKLYVYTTNGLYFCDIQNEKHLKKYLENLNKSIKSKSDLISERVSVVDEPCLEMSISPLKKSITKIDNEISLYEPILSCGGSGGGGSTGGGGTTSTIDSQIPMLVPQSFGSCSYSENSIWQQIFGSRIKCNDYHDSKHRVQTQFWNENYFLWASIGTKVKYQKKRLIGWSESETADFVELGINSVKFTYTNVVKQYNPLSTSPIMYKYKGVTYDLNGQPLNFPANPNPWPYYNKDQTVFELNIFIDNNIKPIFIDTDLGDVNKAINSLIKSAANSLPSYLNFKDDVNKNKVRVNIMKIFSDKTEIVVANRISRDKSSTSYRFDLNFVLTLKSDGSSINAKFFEQFKAKKYDVAEVNLYGAALRNGVWKGKQIIGIDN